MDNESFNSIDLQTKADFVFNHGDYISSIEYYGRKADLFTIGGFYVEAFYNLESGDLEEISIIESTHARLQLYSIGVDIDRLFD